MGHLKLTPPVTALSPRVTRSPKTEAKDSSHLPVAEELALAKIAQRFAPGPHSVINSEEPPVDGHTSLASGPALPSRMHAQTAMLVVATLGLNLGVMSWLGVIELPWSASAIFNHDENTSLPVRSASVAGMPESTRDHFEHNTELRTVVLTAPTILEANVGDVVSLPLALASTEKLPVRSIVAVSGLPSGATLSPGRPYGDREWNLRSDEIGDLRLFLSDTTSGETKLKIHLIGPGGENIASTETLLKVKAEPIAPPWDSKAWPKLAVSSLARAYGSAQEGSNSAEATFGSFDLLVAPPIAEHVKLEPLEPQVSPDHAQRTESAGAETKAAGAAPSQASDGGSVRAMNSPIADQPDAGIVLSEFVNLRENPSSSARVIGVLAKGSRVHPIARERGWVQVANRKTSQKGWIYGRFAASVAKRPRNSKETAPLRVGPGSEESFWTRMGQWVMGPQ
jgi:hypothetical protein